MKVLEWIDILKKEWSEATPDRGPKHHRYHALCHAEESLKKFGRLTSYWAPVPGEPDTTKYTHIPNIPKNGWVWRQVIEQCPFFMQDAQKYMNVSELGRHRFFTEVTKQRNFISPR